jgi:hypothetical protein
VFDGAKSSIMTLHKIAKPLQLFAVLPILTANVSQIDIAKNLPVSENASAVVVSLSEKNGPLVDETLDNKQAELEEKAKKIDQYFLDRGLPLAGYGKTFVEEAEKNDIPWNLLPAIAMIESTGGKHACQKATHSFLGWGSCKINFKSKEDAIALVSKNLGGNNPPTARYYKGKNVVAILNTYNPPQYRRDYVPLVTGVMKSIETQQIKEI